MKQAKVIIIAVAMIWLNLFVADIALATSGACSGHGGVDCSAGADYDGSVICYDSWRDSSVSYSSMVECSSLTAPSNQSSFSDSGSGACSDHGGVDCGQIDLDTTNVVCRDGWKGSSVSYLNVCAKSYQDALWFIAMVHCKTEFRSGDNVALNLCSKNQTLKTLKIGFPDCTEAVSYTEPPLTHVCISYQDYCAKQLPLGYVWDVQTSACVLPTTPHQDVPISDVANNSGKIIKFFVGLPKSKNDLANCSVVGNVSTHLYYRRGSTYIKSTSYRGKICFTDEGSAKKAKYRKSALSK